MVANAVVLAVRETAAVAVMASAFVVAFAGAVSNHRRRWKLRRGTQLVAADAGGQRRRTQLMAADSGGQQRRTQLVAADVGGGQQGRTQSISTADAAGQTPADEKFRCRPAGRELEETAQDRVFSWLGESPQFGSSCFASMQRYFPNALPAKVLLNCTRAVLEEEFGFTPETTLLSTSFCPDEINNHRHSLATEMRNYYGQVFPMGGIGGAPYVGETGFKAFSSHVRNNGDIIVVFGPHTGITMEGEVGKYWRVGQKGLSASCGAVIGAYNACLNCNPESLFDFDEDDMQMSEIKREFTPQVEQLSLTENPMVACAYQAYEMVKDRILRIVNTNFGDGRLVLIGGIQLNMPRSHYSDHFLPLMFEVHQASKEPINLLERFTNMTTQQDLARCPWAAVGAQREVFSWMTWSPPAISPIYRTLHKFFPGALPSEAVHRRAVQILTQYGFTAQNTLLGTSFSPDEINRGADCLTGLLQDYWGDVFPMGGIGGSPFTGRTGFAAFSSHVPEDGNILLAFGPHVGISEDGEVGKIPHKGQANISACDAVVGAYQACHNGWTKELVDGPSYDLQMDFWKRQIEPHAESIARTEDPMAALAHQSYLIVKEAMFTCVNTDFGKGSLCLLGGIQINMPTGYADHFYPMTFQVRQEGQPIMDLISEMQEFR
jgi:hypothetical protein